MFQVGTYLDAAKAQISYTTLYSNFLPCREAQHCCERKMIALHRVLLVLSLQGQPPQREQLYPRATNTIRHLKMPKE